MKCNPRKNKATQNQNASLTIVDMRLSLLFWAVVQAGSMEVETHLESSFVISSTSRAMQRTENQVDEPEEASASYPLPASENLPSDAP